MIDVRTEAALQAILDREVREGPALGATAAVRCEGLGAWSGASGWLDRAATKRLPEDGRFPVYSITKTITAVCVVRLMEIGALELDARIGRWLPDLPFADTVTIRDLLRHTGGISNYSEWPEQLDALAAAPEHAWTVDEFLQRLLGCELDFAPGRGWSYSNTGYLLLKCVVEASNRSTFAAAVEQHVAGPLGHRATRVMAGPRDFDPLVPGFSRSLSNAEPRVWEDVRDRYDPGWCATGVVSSTAAETCELYTALFGGKLVRRDSLAEMTELCRVPAEHAAGFVEPGYGLGLMGSVGALGRGYGHGGGGPGYDLWAWLHPDLKGRQAAVTVFCNTDEASAQAIVDALMTGLESELGVTLRLD